MKGLITLGSFIVILATVQCSTPNAVEEKTSETKAKISLKEVSKDKAFLVDVRTPEEYASGSVEGAVNIPLSDIENRIKDFEGKPNIILFCRSGHRAGIAKSTLESYGIKNVINGINPENVKELLKENK